MSGMRRLLLDTSPLVESPQYRRLWLSQGASQFARQSAALALPYQVYALTNSTLSIGGLAVATIAALLLFALPGGGLADAMDRRRLLVVAQAGQVVVSLALAMLAFQPQPPVMALYVLTFASAALVTIERPARRAALPRLVSLERLPSALVLDSAVTQIARVGGPAFAGGLIVSLGLPAVYFLGAVFFGISLLSVIRLPRLFPEGTPAPLSAGGLVDGLQFVRRNPVLLSSLVIDLSAMTFGLPVALFPVLARDVFGGGPDVLGLLVAAPAIGAVVGTVGSGWIGRVASQGRGVIIAVVVWALAIIAFGLTLWSLPLALIMLGISGAADVVSTVFRGAILQTATPDAMRGRVSALQTLAFQGGPRLGDLEATTVAAFAGAPFAVLSGGVLCLAFTALVVLGFPALAAFRAPVAAHSTATTRPA